MDARALRLEVTDFADANHWRWRLTDPNGAFLADYRVALNPADPKYQALFDLPGYLWRYSSSDKRDEDERRLLEEVGGWIGETLLGSSISEKIIGHGFPPTVVRVVVPRAAEQLLVLPLETAYVRGKPLATHGVSLVSEIAAPPRPEAEPIGDRLRVLALFSVPPEGSPLNLRRERQMLRSLVDRLAGLAIELRVLQYGVTRASLQDALREGEGWDIVHFSGHGMPGSLALETGTGRSDPVSSVEVAQLLRASGRRLKLVVLSACLSAAASIEQTLSWLGIAEALHKADGGAAPASDPSQAPPVVRALIGELDCAVLAMRYAVEDEFATALVHALFDGLFRLRQTLPQATQHALTTALRENPTAGAISLATPALFGAKAAGLQLTPPRRPRRDFAVPETGLAAFPNERARFVGRVAAMTRASAALAAEAEKSGVLFHGMAGAGKTSCAIELVYHHREAGRFEAFVYYGGPERDQDIQSALGLLARAMEVQLPGLTMVHVVDRMDDLRRWLPRLTELLETVPILVVLDNLETLLTDAGQWRDERWGVLVEALLMPGGLSRTVLTSRIRPAGLPDSTEVIPVHALPLREALLLVRELPNLRSLLDGAMPGMTRDSGAQLVRRTLRLVQGHPTLIELVEKMAADPQRLAAQLDRAEAFGGTGELDAFFRDGETRFDEDMFTACLHGWTDGIAATLPEGSRLFFQFLCAMEEGDRNKAIIDMNWADLLSRLGYPEPKPTIDEALRPLDTAGLVECPPVDEAGGFKLLIHPGVAEAGRAAAGPEFQEAVDSELAGTWADLFKKGWDRDDGLMVAGAGLAAFPYLSRLGAWEKAAFMLERVCVISSAPTTIAAVLPRMRRIVEASTGTERELSIRAVLAKVLREAGRPEEAEREMLGIIAQAESQKEFGLASVVAGDLAYLLRESGRGDEAFNILEQRLENSRRADSGRWTLIAEEGQHLQLRVKRGEYEPVLRRVVELLEEMKAFPDSPGPNERVAVWNVREAILDTGHTAAIQLEKWQQALAFTAEISAIERSRSAPVLEQARTQFGAFGPLLQLRRYEEARTVLIGCRMVFERENSVKDIGRVLGALANLESTQHGLNAGRPFAEAALRFNYLCGDPEPIEIIHFNIASYIAADQDEWGEALAHRLAAVMLAFATSSSNCCKSVDRFAADLRAAGEAGCAALPADFAALCAAVERIEGVHFTETMQRLVGNSAACDSLLQQIVDLALEGAKGMSDDPRPAQIALRTADRLTSTLGEGLRDAVVRELAKDPLASRPERVIDPVSLGSLIVSLAAFGWTVYRDLKKDRDVAKMSRPELEQRVAASLREEEGFAGGRLPPGMTTEQQTFVITTIATEIVAADTPP
jgi:hypothetical protein